MSGSHFKPHRSGDSKLTTTALNEDESAPRVVKSQPVVQRVVEEFEFPKLTGPTQVVHFEEPASRPAPAPAAGSRFQMSHLAREALGIGAAERQHIEQAVAERVRAEVEVARAIGIKEGYAEGLAKGHSDGLVELRETSNLKLERLDTLLASMEVAKVAIFEANQKFLIDLCFRVSRSVLLRELSTDRDYIIRLARELVERMGIRENLTLKLHPDDHAMIEELRLGLQASMGTMRNLSIETSKEVRGGGVVLETEWGAIDASLDTQLANIQLALAQATKGAAPEVGA
jgi:flagellar assembly protein FliH